MTTPRPGDETGHAYDEQRLRAVIAGIRRRWFFVEWLRVAMATATITAVAIAVVTIVDMMFGLSDGALLGMMGAAGLLVVAGLVRVAWPLRRRPSNVRVARYIEERVPELEDRLASAVGADGAARRLALFVPMLREAAVWAERVDPDRVVPTAVLRRRGVEAAAAGLLLAVVVTMGWTSLDRAAFTVSQMLWPPTVDILVEPGDTAVVTGMPLDVDARIVGLPARVWPGDVVLEILGGAGSEMERLPMALDAGGRYRAELPEVRHDLTYRVVTARHRSRDYTVAALVPPRVERIDVHYRYPAFSDLAPRVDEEGGDIYAPVGTSVRLVVTTDRPVVAGRALFPDGTHVEAMSLSSRQIEVPLTIERDGAYRLAVVDATGLEGRDDFEYFIRTLDDRPPDVRILRPAGDQKVTRLEEVIIEARADDDHGISRFEIVYAANADAPRVVPLRVSAGTSATGRHVLHLEDLDVEPGDFVTYFARAWDVGRGKRPTEARSDIFFLEIRPFNEEFEAMTSQAQFGAASAGSIDDLATRQKDIIVATWKIERRSGAGQSADDVRAVARAQAELRARASQLAGRMLAGTSGPGPTGRRGRRAAPPEPDADAAADGEELASPMLRAIDAMARAEAELEAMRPREAVPHEMAALNHLLRAESDVRRRQVGRQPQSAQGGGRSGNQDLSALFDRELQRQQETNYEQPRSSSESRAEAAADDAVDRLRELARRQDEISRRQQDLARRRANLPAEEVKRQLERLTREQQALRQAAEQLARDLAESGRDSGQPQSGSAGAGARARSSDEVRRAAESMGQSAGDLEQQRADAASARAGEALERLRAAERRIDASRPDERRRAAGDLQLEARELAEAQRRISREATGQGTADPDRARRLAGEQRRLAERAGRLDEATREIADAADAAERRALAAAVDELRQHRVGDRMREAADALGREAASGPSGAEATARRATEGLADTLDRVARHLGAAAGRDARAVREANDLARTRDLRDRLGELGRDIERLGRATSQREGGDDGGSGSSPSRADGGRAGDGRGEAGVGDEIGRLQAEFLREVQQAEGLFDRLRREDASGGGQGGTTDGWRPGRSAPGTEAFKQDFSEWEVLRQGIELALERLEADLAARLTAEGTRDRIDAGNEARVPGQYRRQAADYYRALAEGPGLPTRPPEQP